jgi:hypothetical protein
LDKLAVTFDLKTWQQNVLFLDESGIVLPGIQVTIVVLSVCS